METKLSDSFPNPPASLGTLIGRHLRPGLHHGAQMEKKLLKIDAHAMHKIKDIAHRIWVQTRKPNGNLIMFEALKQYMTQQGYETPAYEVFELEDK